jgi:hypothetical protein
MAEPIVRELMRADHVDPAAFEALLRSIAASPRPHCTASLQRRRPVWFRSQVLAESLVPAKDVRRITKARFLRAARRIPGEG